MEAAHLRAWWWHRQGLDGSLAGQPPAAILDRAGWARSVGGAGPYLTLFSRGGTSREVAEQAAANLEIHELPSARGCTYFLPAADFALGLAAGAGYNADWKTAQKIGVTEKELLKLCDAVCKALTKGPLDPDAIRAATGSASRSLGEEGKKKGMTTTLPLALGELQRTGRIRRVPVGGRLDQQRYQYTLWQPNPLIRFKLSPDEVAVELARRYFRWIGPASVAEFQTFSGLGVKAAKAAVEPLGLVPLEKDSDRLMFAQDREALAAYKPPKSPHYVLISSIDSLSLLRRDHKSLLDAQDAARQVFGDKALGGIGSLADLPSHAIVDRGRLVGLWEFDPASGAIVYSAWVKDKAVAAAVASMESFVRDQLGDARSFSLDSPASRQPRIQALRSAGK